MHLEASNSKIDWAKEDKFVAHAYKRSRAWTLQFMKEASRFWKRKGMRNHAQVLYRKMLEGKRVDLGTDAPGVQFTEYPNQVYPVGWAQNKPGARTPHNVIFTQDKHRR